MRRPLEQHGPGVSFESTAWFVEGQCAPPASSRTGRPLRNWRTSTIQLPRPSAHPRLFSTMTSAAEIEKAGYRNVMDYAAAIDERRVIQFIYDGLPRLVQPATFGYSTTGKLTLRGCQVDGESRSGVVPDWRPFTVAKIVNPSPAGEVFSQFAMPGYTKRDSMFREIIAEH